jgi:cellulose synthase (UDP-forming)
MKKKWLNKNLMSLLLFLTLSTIFFYISVRMINVMLVSSHWFDRASAIIFLAAELFGLINAVGYFVNVYKVMSRESELTHNAEIPKPKDLPPVVVIVPNYKEPLNIIREALICMYCLNYQKKYFVLLDDSPYEKPWDTPDKVQKYREEVEALCRFVGVNLFRRKRHGAKAGIINDFLKFLDDEPLEQLEFHQFQKIPLDKGIKYLALFDIDMNPMPEFIDVLVPYLENDPKAAFIQTPQYYTNFETNRVARAAGLQQAIFYEYICEGKGLTDAMFCCGSNVLLRREALLDVGSFDESSVTEDFATSLKMHLKGWKTLYYSKVLAFGQGPEDLRSYFTQQFRWSQGTLCLARELPSLMCKNFKKLPLSKWWEYYLSCTYYLNGWFFFVMMIFPMSFLFFRHPVYLLSPEVYVAVFFPYFLVSVYVTLWTLYLRNFKPIYLLNSVMMTVISFPIFMRSAIYALMGRKGTFGVTPKQGVHSLSLFSLWPQILMIILTFSAVVWGLNRIYYERHEVAGVFTNVFWTFYNFLILLSVFYFNAPEEEEEVYAPA